MSTSIVVGGILLSSDQLFRVEELAVGSSSDLVDDRRFEVDEDGPRHVLAGAGLGEEGRERIVAAVQLVRWHVAVGLEIRHVNKEIINCIKISLIALAFLKIC